MRIRPTFCVRSCSSYASRQQSLLYPSTVCTPNLVGIAQNVVGFSDQHKKILYLRGVTPSRLDEIQRGCNLWLEKLPRARVIYRECETLEELQKSDENNRVEGLAELRKDLTKAKRELEVHEHFVLDAMGLPNGILEDTVPLDSFQERVTNSNNPGPVQSSSLHVCSHVDALKSIGGLEFIPMNNTHYLIGDASKLFRSLKDHVFRFVQSHFSTPKIPTIFCTPSHFVSGALSEACYPPLLSDHVRLIADHRQTMEEERTEAETKDESIRVELDAATDPLSPLFALLTRHYLTVNVPSPFVLLSPHTNVYEILDVDNKCYNDVAKCTLYSTSQKCYSAFLRGGNLKANLKATFLADATGFMLNTVNSIGADSLGFRIVVKPVDKLRPFEMARLDLDIYSPSQKSYINVGQYGYIGDYLSERLQMTVARDRSAADDEEKNVDLLQTSFGTVDLFKLFAVLVDNFGLQFEQQFKTEYPNARYENGMRATKVYKYFDESKQPTKKIKVKVDSKKLLKPF